MFPTVRWMTPLDAAAVTRNEETSPGGWSWKELYHFLNRQDHLAMVADYHDQVVGYVVYSRHEKALVIKRIAVLPQFQRMGIGMQMVVMLAHQAATKNRTSIVAKVPDINECLGTHLFMKDCKFKANGIKDGLIHFVRRVKEMTACQRQP